MQSISMLDRPCPTQSERLKSAMSAVSTLWPHPGSRAPICDVKRRMPSRQPTLSHPRRWTMVAQSPREHSQIAEKPEPPSRCYRHPSGGCSLGSLGRLRDVASRTLRGDWSMVGPS